MAYESHISLFDRDGIVIAHHVLKPGSQGGGRGGFWRVDRQDRILIIRVEKGDRFEYPFENFVGFRVHVIDLDIDPQPEPEEQYPFQYFCPFHGVGWGNTNHVPSKNECRLVRLCCGTEGPGFHANDCPTGDKDPDHQSQQIPLGFITLPAAEFDRIYRGAPNTID